MTQNYRQIQQTPLIEPETLEQYLLTHSEVVHLLNSLHNRESVITAYFDGARYFMFSTIIAVLRSNGLVVLDFGPDDTVAERALSAGRLICAAQLDGVTIRFTLDSITKAQYEGREAIAAPIPQSIYRIQRRNLIRIKPHSDTPATCRITLDDGASCTFAIDDISCGGISIVDQKGELSGGLMKEFKGCRLTLPELGELRVDLLVRNRFPQLGQVGIYRYGLQFVDLSTNDTIALQRYITRLQMVEAVEN